ncbi:bifunctional 3'-5' exonuclease/DNA polymerase [Rathayibacter sp. VKM Ac-2803]|uniref:bifunctional 3'-5' exonuclease/DNA polymerase n=1 Tax=unclassified Rathayibacter TaxID=2609250 RepID=UPI00135CAE01|nr:MULTISPECIES: bifunctional 3'-5' exonuclease/DNA polymerase [unclassified Rathayibacter]MWV50231.1 bifunctional 3'-5' exonuclease/DNA polymerase [Rathayibacter sp. VKM Ac-2803]MWV60726.1 bifunctional 3'-5' exonuclease/DNA polymerase [Rathayibacter sp. VKM Ac-2754]
MLLALAGGPTGEWTVLSADSGETVATGRGPLELASLVRAREAERPRWVWDDTARWYPALLEAGVSVARCHDLRLSRAILRRSVATAGSELARSPGDAWDGGAAVPAAGDTLLGFEEASGEEGELDPLEELARQEAALSRATGAGRLRLLLAAESVGALIAREIAAAGLPWSADVHDRVLTEALGPRPHFGGRPERLEALANRIRAELAAPELNPDSPADLIRALRRGGLAVESTRSWELQSLEHPVIAPLLEYKKLSRLLTANGWAWLDSWVHGGRFRPEYVVGGVVTGRWATSGGGALQLPRQIRAAVVADPGWKLVVADAAQLEPRILAAMSGDSAMAAAGRGRDLYQGIVDAGVVPDRARAKVAMLGAMYGATSGEAGRLLPRLARAYPRSVAHVEAAARAGERGEPVSTWLGRSSPPGAALDSDAPDARSGQRAREWGRFTRNFVVQGTAAEWALCWMGELRARLRQGDAHLVYFLHDEVIVHAPAEAADRVAAILRDSAVRAGRALFGDSEVDFPITVAVVDSYDQAK